MIIVKDMRSKSWLGIVGAYVTMVFFESRAYVAVCLSYVKMVEGWAF
jgi:hypothetical protein